MAVVCSVDQEGLVLLSQFYTRPRGGLDKETVPNSGIYVGQAALSARCT